MRHTGRSASTIDVVSAHQVRHAVLIYCDIEIVSACRISDATCQRCTKCSHTFQHGALSYKYVQLIIIHDQCRTFTHNLSEVKVIGVVHTCAIKMIDMAEWQTNIQQMQCE